MSKKRKDDGLDLKARFLHSKPYRDSDSDQYICSVILDIDALPMVELPIDASVKELEEVRRALIKIVVDALDSAEWLTNQGAPIDSQDTFH